MPRPADRPAPHDQAKPDDGTMPGYRPMPSERPADFWLPGDPAAPGGPLPAGLPPIPDYPPVPQFPPRPGPPRASGRPFVAGRLAAGPAGTVAWAPGPGYPAVPPYLSVRDQAPVPGWPPVPAMGLRALPRRLAGLLPRSRRAARHPRGTAGDGRGTAVLGYLTVPVFVVPLVIYLSSRRGPGAARWHAAQALNVWFTGALYDLAAVIMGAMLALAAPQAALIVFAPLLGARWVVTLTYLVRAARAASRGAPYAFPAWLCMRVAR